MNDTTLWTKEQRLEIAVLENIYDREINTLAELEALSEDLGIPPEVLLFNEDQERAFTQFLELFSGMPPENALQSPHNI